MYDWNHDGKKDGIDNFIEYNIYKESTGQSNKSSYSVIQHPWCSKSFLYQSN